MSSTRREAPPVSVSDPSEARRVLQETPYVRYIVVARQDNVFASTCYPACDENRGLVHQLLESDDALPPNLRLLTELRISSTGQEERLARVFKVNP
jgi:hypothetical protein